MAGVRRYMVFWLSNRRKSGMTGFEFMVGCCFTLYLQWEDPLSLAKRYNNMEVLFDWTEEMAAVDLGGLHRARRIAEGRGIFALGIATNNLAAKDIELNTTIPMFCRGICWLEQPGLP